MSQAVWRSTSTVDVSHNPKLACFRVVRDAENFGRERIRASGLRYLVASWLSLQDRLGVGDHSSRNVWIPLRAVNMGK